MTEQEKWLEEFKNENEIAIACLALIYGMIHSCDLELII